MGSAYGHPVIEIADSGCSYPDAPHPKENNRVPDARRIAFFREELTELARAIPDGARIRAFQRGACSTISNGLMDMRSVMGLLTSTFATKRAL